MSRKWQLAVPDTAPHLGLIESKDARQCRDGRLHDQPD